MRSNRRRVSAAISILGLTSSLTSTLLAQEPTGYGKSQAPVTPIENFLGVCQAGNGDSPRRLGVGWNRVDVQWGPDIDHPVNEESLKKQILSAQTNGVKVLPILDYLSPWAAAKSSSEFDSGGVHYQIQVTADAHARSGYKRVRIGTDLATGEEVSRKEISGERGTPDPKAWAAFVERTVSTFSKAPYNIKYWQVWNEGTIESGVFWDESQERYVDNIHIPAAKIIHKYGGKVVWGGWPDCNTLAQYDNTLLYHDAWKYTDILDTHYLPPAAFDYLYQRWVGAGKCEGIWMTEIGFTKNPEQIANTYPRMLYWALTHQFDDPDKYKVFWFAWYSPDDPKAYGYQCSLNAGDHPTQHGKQIDQFSGLLKAKSLTAYGEFRTDPEIGFHTDERDASTEGFQADNRYVMAFHIPLTSSDHWINAKTGDTRHMGNDKTITITLPEAAAAGKTYTAKVVPLPGRDPYDAKITVKGRDLVVEADAPIYAGESSDAPIGPERIFYVVVEPK